MPSKRKQPNQPQSKPLSLLHLGHLIADELHDFTEPRTPLTSINYEDPNVVLIFTAKSLARFEVRVSAFIDPTKPEGFEARFEGLERSVHRRDDLSYALHAKLNQITEDFLQHFDKYTSQELICHQLHSDTLNEWLPPEARPQMRSTDQIRLAMEARLNQIMDEFLLQYGEKGIEEMKTVLESLSTSWLRMFEQEKERQKTRRNSPDEAIVKEHD